MAFHFSLEKVLRWRGVELAAEEAKLEKLVREQLRLQAWRAGLSAENARLDASLNAMADLRGEDLRAASAYRLRLKRQAERVHEMLAQTERELAMQKKKYSEAKQRLRLLEELKTRKFAAWRYEQDTQLEALATESFLATWSHNRS